MVGLNGRHAFWDFLLPGCNGAMPLHRAQLFVFTVGWTMPCLFLLLLLKLRI